WRACARCWRCTASTEDEPRQPAEDTTMRTLLPALLLPLLAVAPGADALAQTAWPDKTVRMVIPFPPGGTLDKVGRMLAQRLGEQLGQTFIVDNKPGGNGVIGGDVVAKATPDGYTLLFN